MADNNELDAKKISQLDPIPASWTSQIIKEFLLQKGLLVVADAQGLGGQNPNTYKVTTEQLVAALDLSEIAQAITIALGLKEGCSSLVFVDTDKQESSTSDDGKTIKYAYATVSEALQTNATIVIVLGSSVSQETISNNIGINVIINLNKNFSLTISDNVVVANDLVIKSEGSVTIGDLSYVSSVNLLKVEAKSIDISACSVKSMLRADTINFSRIENDSDIFGKDVTINETSSGKRIRVDCDKLTFTNGNSINGIVNVRTNTLSTYPINFISGTLLLSIGNIELLDSGTCWLHVNSTNGADVCAFVKSKPSFYAADTDYKGYTISNANDLVNVTYAGIFPSLYDSVVNNQEELNNALSDSSVKSIFINGVYNLYSSNTINGEKVFYGASKSIANRYGIILNGGTIGSSSNPVELAFTIPITGNNVDTYFYGNVKVTDILGNGSISISGVNNEGFYERNNSQVVLTGFTQNYWFTPVSVNEYDVVSGENISVQKSIVGNKTTFTINGSDSVPNVNVTSNDNSVNVTTELNPLTNVKNIDLSVLSDDLQYGLFTSIILESLNGDFTLNMEYGNIDFADFKQGLYDISIYATVTIKDTELVDDNISFNLDVNSGGVLSKQFVLDGSLSTAQVVFDARISEINSIPVISYSCSKLCTVQLQFSLHSVSSSYSGNGVKRIVDDCSNWVVSEGSISDNNLSWTLSKTSTEAGIIYDTLTVSIPNNVFCDIQNLPTTIVDGSNTYTITNLVVNVPNLVSGVVLQQSAFQIDFESDNTISTSITSDGVSLISKEIPTEYKSSSTAVYQFSVANGCVICSEFLK